MTKHGSIIDDEFPMIYKRDLRRFFDELKEQAHYLYALLAGVPKSVFWIVLENEDVDEEQTFTVREFYANLIKFRNNRDSFRVNFKTYYFREEWDECVFGWQYMDNPFIGEGSIECNDPNDLAVAMFTTEWKHLLAYICRQMILANTPLCMNREIIKRYGFTREDVKLLREPVAWCNERIIAELREQYDKLAAIDCLHESPKKRTRLSASVLASSAPAEAPEVAAAPVPTEVSEGAADPVVIEGEKPKRRRKRITATIVKR